VMISFCSWYRKTSRRMGELEGAGWEFEKEPAGVHGFLSELTALASSRGMKIYSCAGAEDYSDAGIENGSCVDATLINTLWGLDLPTKKDPGQREHCLCAPSKDIGVKDTCVHGCKYCYSTVNDKVAGVHYEEHDPEAPTITGVKSEKTNPSR